jgi:hypothetical protein
MQLQTTEPAELLSRKAENGYVRCQWGLIREFEKFSTSHSENERIDLPDVGKLARVTVTPRLVKGDDTWLSYTLRACEVPTKTAVPA